MQPDVAESGRVWFLGEQYVDRVVRDGQVVYNRNYIKNTFTDYLSFEQTSWDNRLSRTPDIKPVSGRTMVTSVYVKNSNAEEMGTALFLQWENWDLENTFTHTEKSSRISDSFNGRAQITNTFKEDDVSNSCTLKRSNLEAGAISYDYCKVKAELGTTATPYTVAPEDLFPSASNLLPDWLDDWEGEDDGMMIERG